MYSVVLLMAMSGAPDTPAGLFHKGGHSCCGCQGYAAVESCGCHGERGGRKHRGGNSCCGCMGHNAGCCGQQTSCGCCGQQMQMGCGCCGGMMMGAPMGAPGAAPGAPKMETTPAPGTRPAGGGGMVFTAAPATLVVNLPADATLSVDGVATKAANAVRQFSTPVLAAGQSYHYTLTAEIVRDGKTYSASETVTVRAGQISQVELPATAFGTAVAAK